MNIAICDDDILTCKELQNIIENLYEDLDRSYSVNTFLDGETLIKDIDKCGSYDIIFLDIRMGAMTGIDAGKIIRDIYCDEKTKIIFVSALKDYVFEAFDARPMHFITKPITKEKVEAILLKAIKLVEKQKQIFKYKSGHHTCSILLSDILYFESILRMIRIVTTSEVKEFYGKISDLTDMNLNNFMQIHRSYLINATQIDEHTYSLVTMKNGQQLSISQNRRKEVMQKLTKLTISKLNED